MKNFKYKKIFFLTFLFLFSFIKTLDAASLSVGASASQVKIGDIVTATVYVNAGGEAVNNIEGLLVVPSDILEVQSVSSSGSILNLWVEQPTYARGSVTFNGGVTNPGYSGTSGKVVTIFMKALKNGTASLAFQSASVRANDGLGTDVLKNKTGTNITVASVVAPEVPVTPVVAPVISTAPGALRINSSVTPDSNLWYKANSTIFSWDLPGNALAIKTLFDTRPDSDPTILYNSKISSKAIENIEDGVWYFHLKYQTAEGWSKTAHKKIKIDTTPPDETLVSYKTLDSGLIELSLSGNDSASYLSKYVLSVEGKEKIEITDIDKKGKATFVFSSEYSGLKEIKIQTFDEAGNMQETIVSIDFPKINIPEITTYPNSVGKDEEFVVGGISTYPNSQIEIYIQNDTEESHSYKTNTREDGSFSLKIKNTNKGKSLGIWAKISAEGSSGGIVSEKIYITTQSFSYIEWGKKITSILAVFVPIIALVILLLAFIYLVFVRLILADKDRERNKKIKKIEKEALALMDSLKSNILEDIHLFKADKNIQNTDEAEMVLLKNLLQDFKNIEKVISTKLKRNKVGKKEEGE